MKKVSKSNNMEKCSDLDTFDFKPWKEAKHGTARVKVDDASVEIRAIKN